MSVVDTKHSSLATLAMLKVNYDLKKNYVDTFLPFVLDCLPDGELLNVVAIQNEVHSKYHLKIPLNSLITILKRARRKRLVRREDNDYMLFAQPKVRINVDKLRNQGLREQGQLLQSLIDFCSNQYEFSLSADDAENALFNFIRHRDIQLLKSTVFGSPFKDDLLTSRKLTFYVGQFVKHVSESNQEVFNLLASFIKAYMLSELLIFENVADLGKPFGHIDFYLDTQFVLRVLRYTDPILAYAAQELTELLYNEGANIYIFDHTYQEMVGILTACENSLCKPNFRPLAEVGRYCVQNGVTPSDLRLIIVSLEEQLRDVNIKVMSTPPREHAYHMGEKELVEYLDTNYRYRNPRARDKDVDSISAIYRLRKGQKPASLRNCEAVFITTNANLAKHTYAFLFREENYTYFPLLITDHLATNLLWARNPNKYNNISQKQLLADAFALLNPTDQIWEKYYNEIEKLRLQKRLTDDEALMLLWSSEIQAAIMDITEGGEVEPNEGNVFDIIMRAKERITGEERLQIEQLKNELHVFKEKSEQAKQQQYEIDELKKTLDRERHSLNKIQSQLRRACKITSWIVVLLLSIPILLAIFRLAPTPFDYVAMGMLGIFTFLNLLFGTTLVRLRRRIESQLYARLKELIL